MRWAWGLLLCVCSPYVLTLARSIWRIIFKKTKAPKISTVLLVSMASSEDIVCLNSCYCCPHCTSNWPCTSTTRWMNPWCARSLKSGELQLSTIVLPCTKVRRNRNNGIVIFMKSIVRKMTISYLFFISLQVCSVETIHSIGLTLFVFKVLPSMHIIRGMILMMGFAFLPSILKIFNRPYIETQKWIKVRARDQWTLSNGCKE